MAVITNTYSTGIDQDSSPHKMLKTSYYLLMDGHVVTEEDGLSTGDIENERGTALSFTIPDTYSLWRITGDTGGVPGGGILSASYIQLPAALDPTVHAFAAGHTMAECYADMLLWYAADITAGSFAMYLSVDTIFVVGLDATTLVTGSIYGADSLTTVQEVTDMTGLMVCGWATSRDEVILFTTDSCAATPGQNGLAESFGQIWKFHYNEVTKLITGASPSNELVPSQHLYYNNKLNFSTYNRVKKTIARYENAAFSKIYFTDGYNNLRHFNFNDADHFILDPSKLDLLPNVDMSVPLLRDIQYGGTLRSGRYQYCYQLCDRYGTETLVSPVSNLVDISSHNDRELISRHFYGSVPGVHDCNKVITMLIPDIDYRFDFARIIAVHYEDIASDPDIRVLEDINIETGTIAFYDGGDPGIDTLTAEEFTSLGGKLFTCQTLESKNNKLFAGNIQDTYFDIDFDARCFRYRDDPMLGEVTYSQNIVPGVDQNDINPYNSISNDGIPNCRYIYQKGYTPVTMMPVLGGTGVDQFGFGVPNVSYTFGVFSTTCLDGDRGFSATELYAERDPATPLLPDGHVNNSWRNYKSAYISDYMTGYQRDEVYRFGIVFFDKRHRPSFVKWIGDIRMPAMGDKDTFHPDGFPVARINGAKLNSNQTYVLCPVFTVNIPTAQSDPQWAEVDGFEIVRVKREGNDKTILAQGLLSRKFDPTPGHVDPAECIYIVYADRVFEYGFPVAPSIDYLFYSPECNFNKNLAIEETDHFRIEGEIPFSAPSVSPPTLKVVQTFSCTATDPIDWDNIAAAGTINDYREFINTINIDSNWTDPVMGIPFTTAHGTLVFDPAGQYFHLCTSATDAMFVNYRRLRTTQYGGNTITARANSEYITCGKYVPVSSMTPSGACNSITVHVYGGDTFVTYFDFCRGRQIVLPLDPVVIYFPCESTVNTELRMDPCYSRAFNLNILEYGNPHDSSVFGGPYATGDLYAYNSAYSREADMRRFFPRPVNFQDNMTYDARIYNSQQRHSDQILDNWTKFLYNDFTEVDQSRGALTKLIHWKNVMYFIQSQGIGAIAIDERVSTLDQSGATLVLGTGEVLGKYGYISESSGSIHHDSIVAASSGLHYFDIRNRKWMLYTGEGNYPLNDLKGLTSFFLKNLKGHIQEVDKPLYYGRYPAGISAVYDIKRNRVLMTFLDYKTVTSNGSVGFEQSVYTFGYNELMKAFEQALRYYPSLYLNNRDRVLALEAVTPDEGHILDLGTRGEYFGRTPVDMELIIPCHDTTVAGAKLFTNIQFNSAVTLAGADQYNETLNTIEVYNDYQNSGILALVPGQTIKRRNRTWRAQLPRSNDYRSTNYNPAAKQDARMLDEYVFIRLKYTNNNDKRITLGDITTTYIPKPA